MGAKYGFLVPDDYVPETPNAVDMNTSSIFWGFSLGVAVFTASKAAKQGWRSWGRTKSITPYVSMVWGVWLSSMVLGVLAWTFQREYIKPSFAFFFNIVFFWSLQVQLLLQIILNRLGLLIVVPGRAKKLKWIVFFLILLINISVFSIWVPARLQINPTWVRLNNVWDRCEKVIFGLIDLCLNSYFVYLVRSRLIDNGLSKYTPLYQMNLGLIFISLALDVVLVGLMSLQNSFVYLSFHPVCYLLKLQIEMKMAELITKIVRSTGATGSNDVYYRQSSTGKSKTITRGKKSGAMPTGTFHAATATQIRAGDYDDIELENGQENHRVARQPGILKTVQTTVARDLAKDGRDDDIDSKSSGSERGLTL